MTANTVNSKQDVQPSLKRKVLVISIPILILILAVLVIGALSSLNRKPEIKKRKAPIIAVMATQAIVDTVQLSVTVQGEAQPRTEIDLVPEVAGKIVSVSPKFLPGDLFRKGDVLYTIDESDYRVAVVRAEAGVAQAQQVLVRERAESEIARRDWEDLGEGEASDLTLRIPQLLQAQANLQSAEADLENAKIKLARTNVRAPFDGRVREKYADLGQYVGPGARLGRIYGTDVAEVRLALSDADLSRLNLPIAYVAKSYKEAPTVKIHSRIGGEERTWNGKIMRTDAAYDKQTRALFAIVEVHDPYGKGMAEGRYPLAPGLYVNAEIAGRVLESAIVIPRDGLRPGEQVYLVNEKGVSESKPVQVLDANPERAVIGSGVEIGDIVILSPMERSQINVKFKALDIADGETVLREPPEEPEEEEEDPVSEAQAQLVAAQMEFNKAKREMVETRGELNTAKKAMGAAKKKSGKKEKTRKKKKKSDQNGNNEGAKE